MGSNGNNYGAFPLALMVTLANLTPWVATLSCRVR